MSKNYYRVLGISKNATSDEIKAAYRKLARKHHPDLNPHDTGAKRRFQAITEANEILSDPEKKEHYDKFGAPGKSIYRGGRSSASDRKRPPGTRGFDYIVDLKLTIREAAKEHVRTIQFAGRTFRLRIPAGVGKYHQLVLHEKGGPGINGGPNGDLILNITVMDDSHWTLIERDIHSIEPVDLFIALLEGKVVVETPDGPVKVTIKPETPNGAKLRIKGKGYPGYNNIGPAGDFWMIIVVLLPCGLDAVEKELFNQIAVGRKSLANGMG